jgi:hypothetical protein
MLFNLCQKEQSGLQCPDFHETHKNSTALCVDLVPNFIEIGQYIRNVRVGIYLHPWVKWDFRCVEFHDTHHRSTSVDGQVSAVQHFICISLGKLVFSPVRKLQLSAALCVDFLHLIWLKSLKKCGKFRTNFLYGNKQIVNVTKPIFPKIAQEIFL